MVAWCGIEDHIVEENMFSNRFQLKNMGPESSTFCTLQRFASDPFVHPCLWVAKRGVLVRSSQDVWLHTGNTDTSAVVIFLVVILFFILICLSVQWSSSKLTIYCHNNRQHEWNLDHLYHLYTKLAHFLREIYAFAWDFIMCPP